jgi:hypothetical protein
MADQSDLIGMFLVLDSVDHEHYRTGEIIAAVGNCFLIQFDKIEAEQPLPPTELVTLEELTSACADCGGKRGNLFRSRTDMEEWLAYLNAPKKPPGKAGKVVHLKKPRPRSDDGGPTKPPAA